MILLAVACLIFVSCGNKTEKVTDAVEETATTLTPEQQEMFANWENWDNLEPEAQVALVGEMKAFLDECKAKCESKEAEETEEVCPEKAAKCAEMKAAWEAFDTFTVEEQKAMIDEILQHKCCKDKAEAEKAE